MRVGLRYCRPSQRATRMPADARPAAVNVLGLIAGSDPVLRDQVVLIGAHYDHVGIGAGLARRFDLQWRR